MGHILFINDDPKTIQPLQDHLIERGHQVSVAHHAGEGIKSAMTNHPDVIFVDSILPGVTGSQIIHKLRQETVTRWTPIILLDWPGNHPALKQFAQAMGASEVVQKSVKVIELGDMVGRYVQMKNSREDLVQAILYINRASPAPDEEKPSQ